MWQKQFFILFPLSAVAIQFSSGQTVADCAPEAMSRCTDPLKVVTDNKDLGFATSEKELNEMCPKLLEGLRCIDDFTLKCLDREHRAYFNTLYAGTTQVIIDLCQAGEYQRDYLRHAPCMRNVQNGYEKCAEEYQVRIKSLNERNQKQDLDAAQPKVTYEYYDESGFTYEYDESLAHENGTASEVEVPSRRRRRQVEQTQQEYGYDYNQPDPDENVRLLCCSFQRYLQCSEKVVNETCGHETALFTKSFLDRMSGPLIQGHCQAYEFSGQACGLNEGKWPETKDTGHVSHYSKTTSHFSGSTSASASAIIVFVVSLVIAI